MLLVVPIALPVILGPRWDDATTYFLVLSPMLLINIVAAPFHAPGSTSSGDKTSTFSVTLFAPP